MEIIFSIVVGGLAILGIGLIVVMLISSIRTVLNGSRRR